MTDRDYWLGELKRRRWTLYKFALPEDDIFLMGATFFWETHADVVIIRDETTATAHRTPPCRDVFRPQFVTRAAAGTVSHVLGQALTWPEPSNHEPSKMTAPPGCAVPADLLKPSAMQVIG